MRIVIDMQGAQEEINLRGPHLTTLFFVQALVRTRGNNDIILVLNGLFPDTIEPIRAAFQGLLPQESIRVWYTPAFDRGNQSTRSLLENIGALMREAFISSHDPDVVHISSILNEYSKKTHNAVNARNNQVLFSAYLEKTRYFGKSDKDPLTNSKQKRYEDTIAEYLKNGGILVAANETLQVLNLADLGATSKNIVRLPAALKVDAQSLNGYDRNAAVFLQSLGIVRPFAMAAGVSTNRTNTIAILLSYEALPAPLRRKHQLILVGKSNPASNTLLEQQKLSSKFESDEIIWINDFSEDQISQLYKYCEMYIHTESTNRQALPVADPETHGEMVIGKNYAALPRVIGLHSAQFDPVNISEFVTKMALGLGDKSFRATLQARSSTQESKFAWDQVASWTTNALNDWVCANAKLKTTTSRDSEICETLVTAIADLPNSTLLTDKELLPIAEAIAQNHPTKNRQPKLFIDISDLVRLDHKTGVQRVTKSILLELLKDPPLPYEVQAVYASTDILGYRMANEYTQSLMDETDARENDSLIEVQPGDIFIGLDLQHTTTIFQEPYLSRIRQNGAQVWFVVYDLLPIQFPDFWPKENRVTAIHQQWLHSVSKFDGVACISKSVAMEMKEWLETHKPERLRPLKVEWFHLGADIKSSSPSFGLPEEANEVLQILKSKISFLMVGTIEPRKAHSQVLNAFELLWRAGIDINLVIVGKQGWLVDRLIDQFKKHPELGKRLLWLNAISDEYLIKLYEHSSCLIAASYGEGFGLPLIEAAQFELPIIARDIPIFREVAGHNAFYFRGTDAKDLACALEEWISMNIIDNEPKSKDIPWLSWKDSAGQLQQCVMKGDLDSIVE